VAPGWLLQILELRNYEGLVIFLFDPNFGTSRR
jgi:hypothetical protein